MPEPFNPDIYKYIRGIGTDYEPGAQVQGSSFLNDKYVLAKKIEWSNSINTNSIVGEPPIEDLEVTLNKVIDFYGSKSFSWIIKSDTKYTYLEKALNNIGMSAEKTFFGMYFQLGEHSFENLSTPGFSILDVKNKEQIGDVVDLNFEIFNLNNPEERENMIHERLTLLTSPENRSGFSVVYVEGRPVAYSRHRISQDGLAMYLNGSGVLKEFRGNHIYLSLLKHRAEIARQKGCKLLTVFATSNTSKPILERLGFSIEGKYLFMTIRKENKSTN